MNKAQAKINGHWCPVEVLEIAEILGHNGMPIGQAAKVKALPINGWQPHPFTLWSSHQLKGAESKSTVGVVMVENLKYEEARETQPA